MTLLEKIIDSLSEQAKEVAGKMDTSKSADEIASGLEEEGIICFNVSEKHDQEIH